MAREKRGYVGIWVREETRKKLQRIKAEVGARSWDELFNRMAEALEKYRRLEDIARVCNDMSSYRASPLGWAKLFRARGVDPVVGFSLLKRSGEDLVVDREKCREVVGSE